MKTRVRALGLSYQPTAKVPTHGHPSRDRWRIHRYHPVRPAGLVLPGCFNLSQHMVIASENRRSGNRQRSLASRVPDGPSNPQIRRVTEIPSELLRLADPLDYGICVRLFRSLLDQLLARYASLSASVMSTPPLPSAMTLVTLVACGSLEKKRYVMVPVSLSLHCEVVQSDTVTSCVLVHFLHRWPSSRSATTVVLLFCSLRPRPI